MNFVDLDKFGSDGLKSIEARILMNDVSVVSASWMISNAASIIELEMNRERIRAAKKHGIRCLQDQVRDSVMVACKISTEI